jgi:tetratricopeptide (TPR) repeat protein
MDKATSILKQTLQFDVDPQRKVPIYYNLSVYSLLKQDYPMSLAYLDSVEKLGYKDADLMIRRGWVYQSQGNYPAAEQSYQNARMAEPNRPEPIQSLVSLYTEYMKDTAKAKAVLQQWLQRNPNDGSAKQMLQSLEQPAPQVNIKK